MPNNNQTNKEQIATRINEYITETFLYDREEFSLTNDFPLIEQRVINSIGILRLMTFLEEEFGVTVDAEGIVLDNFETIDAMAALLLRKSSETHGTSVTG